MQNTLLIWLPVIITLIVLVVLPIGVLVRLRRRYPETKWDWEWTDTSEVAFPKRFLWGVATAAHQVEGGCTNNNWSRWENGATTDGSPHIKTGEVTGTACENWTRYPEDIELIRELGCNAYRMSVEWSKIEPRLGEFDETVLAHYREIILALRAAGIEPMVTLHHFTNPLWFEDLGAFEKSENIKYLVRFSEKVFATLRDQVTYWCTLNEPAVYASMGYFMGDFPPGKRSIKLTGTVLKNTLRAHVEIYTALKKLPGGDRAKIGLVKNLTQFDPLRRTFLLDWLIARTLHNLFNTSIYQFLKTGKFLFSILGIPIIRYHDDRGKHSNDFIGLNYYSRLLVKFGLRGGLFKFVMRPDDVKTDMAYAMYPEGIYRALMETSGLNLPIIITENGIADKVDNNRFPFIRTYLYAVSQAIKEGVDVRGYFYWSLMDNFEWAEGYSMKFGLYAVDFKTQERTLRAGSEAYRMVIKSAVDG